jgi:antitoxin component of MazEF toxin-antitoxin module
VSKISRIGSSNGVIIPAAILKAANLRPQDEVILVAVQDGVVVVARNSPIGKAVAATLDIMDQYEDTFRKLAK